MSRTLSLACCLLVATHAGATDPDAYDPLLDAPPSAEEASDDPYAAEDPRAPGFMVGGFGGVYLGAVHSFLTKERSALTAGSRPFVGFGLGYRTPSLIEIGVDLGLGLGRTYVPRYDVETYAFDAIIQPRLLAHLFEGDGLGIYAGVAAEAILFDVEPAGLNQAGVGPAGVVGVLHRLGPHSLLFVELVATGLHDFLAYHYEDPSPEALMEDPTLERRRVDGKWYGIARVAVGYRLTAL